MIRQFTGFRSALCPYDRAGSVRNKARSSRAAFLMPNNRRAFRLRFGDGRFVPLRSCVSAPLLHLPVHRTAGQATSR